jgi:hypothetical protein
MKYKHLLYCPWTGLGLYNGYRGDGWLKNRIQIFKQFVIPSIQNQTAKNLTLWCSWRPEEKNNPIVKELIAYLDKIKEFNSVHTFHGVCFWDDKYPDDVAQDRLLTSLHGSLAELTDVIGDVDNVYMTLQPSDDMYEKEAMEMIRRILEKKAVQAAGFKHGYVINLQNKEVAEWNPKTNPPFFTIKFPRSVFLDPLGHFNHSGPYKSHEYVGDKLNYAQLEYRGFMVGTHGENISTVFDHPFKKSIIDVLKCHDIRDSFGIGQAFPLKLEMTRRRVLFNKLSYKVKRKLRFLAGEKKWILRPIFSIIYNWLRG